MSALVALWALFALLAVGVSIADYFVVTHAAPNISVRSALRWTCLWIALALGFALATYLLHPGGQQTAMLFISGYLTEYSLSVDNLFVFLLIFALMGVKPEAQPKLLKLGIYLSIALRILFIVAGVALVERFHWVIYLFGVLLVWTAWKMLFSNRDDQIDPTKNIFYRLVSTCLPIAAGDAGTRLTVRKDGKLHATSLFLAFVVIGSTDVLFAVDSIPAIMGISTDPFVVITSNVFAVLGLNSLFFALRGVMNLFKFLKHGVSLILLFIGGKMTVPGVAFLFHRASLSAASDALLTFDRFFRDRTWLSLAVIASLLSTSILASIIYDARTANDGDAPK